jgi:hypothetical protein
VLIDFFDAFLSNSSCRFFVPPKRLACLISNRNATHAYNCAQASHRVSPPTEAEQEYPIAGAPKSDDGGIAVDNVARNAKPGGLTDKIVEPTDGGSDEAEALMTGPSGAKAGVVEGSCSAGLTDESGPQRVARKSL